MTTKPFRDGQVFVCAHECDTCVFKKGNVMDLRGGRLKNLVRQNLEAGSALTCHKTIYDDPKHNHAICQGFFDRFKAQSPALLLAEALDIITFIEPPSSKP